MAKTAKTAARNPALTFGNAWKYAPAPESTEHVVIEKRYGLFVGGEFVRPKSGKHFATENPATGEKLCEVAHANDKDVDAAVQAAKRALPGWRKLSGEDRARYLFRIARILQERAREFAVLETLDNGKPIKETRDVDVPLAAQHFFYHAGWADKLELLFPGEAVEPVGVVGQVIPWNFPLLMAAWKLAPALAAGNCVVLKPAEQTPATILLFAEKVASILPPGVLNIVNGFGVEAGKPLASNRRIAKIAFTGETTTGRLIMQYASENLIPVTLELGGKSPNVFFEDVFDKDDDFRQKVLEGFAMFALNQGEVCTCPSRALVAKKIYPAFLDAAVARAGTIEPGDPLDTDTRIGAQASNDQLEKILSYIDIGKKEGAKLLLGGARAEMSGDLKGGYYVQPTIFEGHNKMRVFQEEIFGPVVSVTSFEGFEDAIEIANDTLYGLGAGVWSRDTNTAYRAGRAIQAGRVWTNCYHLYPAHAAFGGYKQSGIGRETHKMMLSQYQQTKNLLVSYDPNPMGFF